MHFIERQIHPASEETLEPDVAADEVAHEVADRRVLAERYQRAEISIAPWTRLAPGEYAWDPFEEIRSLLVSSLRPRWHIATGVGGPFDSRAIADREHGGVIA